MSSDYSGYKPVSTHSPGDSRSVSPSRGRSRSRLAIDTETIEAVRAEEDAHVGVKKVEATQRVYGKYSRWFLYIGLGLASYIYSLDASTTSSYLPFATSSFGKHTLISSIQLTQSLVVAVGKPVIAKVADVSSRGTAYLGVLCFYVAGYVTIASAPHISAVAGGIVFYAVGFTGLQLLTQIIIADITTLKWRGLVTSLVSAPFLLNGFVGSQLFAAVNEHLGWRWGYGMFAIFVPLALFPLIVVLLWAERKANKLGIIDRPDHTSHTSIDSPPSTVTGPKSTQNAIKRFKRVAEQLDLIGLVLLGGAVSLILLPISLSRVVGAQWQTVIIVLLFIGFTLLFAFAVWDLKFASRPVIAPRFIMNRSVVAASLIGFFDFMSFFLTFIYLFSFVLVVKPWSLLNANYFVQIQTISLTFFGIMAGLSMRFFHRYKYVLIAGLLIRLLGVALMIYTRDSTSSNAALIWTQILQGMGGGFSAVSSQVGAQASVPHADVGMITAVVLLLTEIGGAVGNAVAGAIWAKTMPENLKKYLPFLSDAEIAELFGSITSVSSHPLGDPIREGAILAYGDTMKDMVVVATVLSVIPLILALIMPNWYLGDRQNAVDEADLTGHMEFDDDDDEDGDDFEDIDEDEA